MAATKAPHDAARMMSRRRALGLVARLMAITGGPGRPAPVSRRKPRRPTPRTARATARSQWSGHAGGAPARRSARSGSRRTGRSSQPSKADEFIVGEERGKQQEDVEQRKPEQLASRGHRGLAFTVAIDAPSEHQHHGAAGERDYAIENAGKAEQRRRQADRRKDE